MRYQNGKDLLPQELLTLVQQYAEGKYLYIPRVQRQSPVRASRTDHVRNAEICRRYHGGESVRSLAQEYFLSTQAVYRVLAKEKK